MKIFVRLSAVALIASSLVIGTNPLSAQDADPHPEAAYRQSLMKSIDGHMRATRSIVEGVVPHESDLPGHAAALDALITSLGNAFPEGSGGEGSRARPEVWSNDAGFAEQLQIFSTAASGFLASVQSGDSDAMAEAFSELRQTCRGCHSDFRARPSPPGL